jgi:hypothetical protein
MVQGPRRGQYGTQNPEMTKGQEETVETPGMQQWHKGLRPETATTWQQDDRGPLQQTAATLWELEGTQQDLLEDHSSGDIEASCRDFQLIEKNHKFDYVER